MKFLFLMDSQIRGNNPINRNGSFLEDMEKKFDEAIQIGKDMMVDEYIHGGDFWDRPIVSLSICDMFADKMERSGKPWKIVRGNHDEIGHNPNLSGETTLDHLFRRSKLIQHLGGQATADGTAFIEGFDYYHNIEKDIKEKGLKCSCPHIGTRKIAVVHALITPFDMHPSIMHVKCDEIDSDFDLVLCAHFHYEWGIHRDEKTKTTYVGIGAMARMSIGEWDCMRRPNVLYVDTAIPTMKIIPLESARAGIEVFDLEAVKLRKETANRIDDFIQSLDNAKFQGMNLRGIIEKVAEEKQIKREVVDFVVAKIGEFE